MNLMQKLQKCVRREQWLAWLQIVLGCLIGAAAYPTFLDPGKIAPGGLTGVAMILKHLWGWDIGITSLFMNIPLFLIGYKAMGRVFAFRSLVATILFSLAIDLMPLKEIPVDPILGTLYGGILLGIGLGFILRGGATTGGTDMCARMVHKYLPFLSVGMFLFLIDCVVVLAAWFFIGSSEALYALICIFVSGKAVDMVMLGLSHNKACFVITEAWERVSQRLMTEMERGVTQLSARGAYTGNKRPVVLCVLPPQEVSRLKEIVRQEDEKAFMFVTEAHEALGEGFSSLMED
ncbi:MAG: YitT family protein [Clostridiales bacterium]|nr:YitT family protein [Clostridiales bacterium]